ncbi:restriction endonuclease subunit S [Sporosarcina sp. P29]|uniref:restriction endonuclease subunit S n=1 Tax=Sporosarcina sp. P29 TaxID=2048252 RepID=UPI000C16B652|nr:restriction endonuclease subunit S [Sporosarcina sp. P29]PIC98218.1 hypothetical protein CSV68_14275 [Sporosarcina sp. P29]
MKAKKLVPKRRFKEFQNTDAWEQRKYGEVIDLLSGQDFSPSEYNDKCNGIPYMTGASCIVGKETIVNRWTTVPRCLAEKGDVLLVCKGSGYGAIAVLAQDKAHIARQFMALQNLSDLDKIFNFYLINSVIENIKKDARGLIAGIARDAVIKQEISIPSLAEQAQIGSLLKTLDDIIAVHQRKLEKSKALKSAYLAEMFPAEGERVPKRRFAGFTGEWKQRRLDELAEVRTGKAFSSLDFNDDGEYLVITNKDVNDQSQKNNRVNSKINITDENILSRYLLKGNNILITMDGNVGRVRKVTNENAVLAQRVARLNSDQLEFVYQITRNNNFLFEMNKVSVGNIIKHISLQQIAEYSFLAPISKEEQQAIGEFFKKLDDTITNQQQKLEKLKAMKQAYLEEMFV